ncbi:MAG TPA: ABC transporter permease subunit, partial [Acetobacteraceae bacterium]
IILAHATLGLAYVALVVQARLEGEGTALEEAAGDLGASPPRAFIHVTLPLIAPALLSGWLLAFTLSLDDVVVASFTSGPGATTLPMVLLSTLRLGATPVLNALASVMLAIVAAGLLVAWRLAPVARSGAPD